MNFVKRNKSWRIFKIRGKTNIENLVKIVIVIVIVIVISNFINILILINSKKIIFFAYIYSVNRRWHNALIIRSKGREL